MEHIIDELRIKVDTEADSTTSGIENFEKALSKLKEATKGGITGLGSAAKQITSFKTALSGIALDTNALSALKDAMISLSAIPKASGLSSTVNSLKKIPEITKQLTGTELYKFSTQIKVVANAVKPLATEMEKVANGFSAFPSRIQKLIKENEKLSTSNQKVGKSFKKTGMLSLTALANYGTFAYGLRKVISFLSSAVNSINAYVENVNLFQVSMGEFYEEAYAYAELVNNKLGVDPSEWMRNQGVFMSMATGFGLAKKQAYDLSESLNELTYDISSLYNEDMTTAAQRLQSALAGEIEPIRRLGISISQATLEEFALAKGIKENVANMTEQEKALLRSIKLIEDASKIGAVGDFVKTLESPANAMRVLKQQITQLSRAIGSILLPTVIQVIPYMQAFVSILTDAAKWIADLVGFEMPKWNNEDWNKELTNGAGDAENALEEATDAAKKLKKETLGIDELNIISDKSDSAAGTGENWASNFTIPDLWDKAALEEMTTKAQEIKEKMLDMLPAALAVGAAIALWKFGPDIITGVKAFAELVKIASGHAVVLSSTASKLATTLKFAGVTAVIATMVARFADLYRNSEKFRKGLSRIKDIFSGFKTVVVDIFSGITKVFSDIGTAALGLLPDSVRETVLNFFSKVSDFLASLDLDWKDLAITVAGFGLLFVPGGQFLGLALLAFESITVEIRKLGGISDETWAKMKQAAADMWNSLKKSVSNGWNAVVDFFDKSLPSWWNNTISPWFSRQKWDTLFSVMITTAATAIIDFAHTWSRRISEWWNSDVQPWFTWTRWSALFAVMGKTLVDEVTDTFSTWRSRISEWWSSDVQPWFKLTKWITLFSSIGKGIKDAVLTMIDYWDNLITDWWNNYVVIWFKASTWKQLAADAVNGLKQGFSNLYEIGKSIGSDIADGINSAISKVKNSSSNKSSGNDDEEEEIVLWEKSYASGGFPSTGQVFLSRENGPELVGTIGGSSAVVNNSQIVEAVSAGVASAVASVLGGSGGDTNVVVYLDGEKIYSNQQKVAARKGYGISLNPSFSL